MSQALEKARALLRNRTTYGVGLLQARAYRVLKERTDQVLAPYGITSVHWAFLGLLHEHRKGMRLNEAARELAVEAPFVTTLANHLSKKGWLETNPDPRDSRAKCAVLTKEGHAFVKTTEALVRSQMRSALGSTSMSDLLSYLLVLEEIVNANP